MAPDSGFITLARNLPHFMTSLGFAYSAACLSAIFSTLVFTGVLFETMFNTGQWASTACFKRWVSSAPHTRITLSSHHFEKSLSEGPPPPRYLFTGK